MSEKETKSLFSDAPDEGDPEDVYGNLEGEPGYLREKLANIDDAVLRAYLAKQPGWDE